ncbi:hypothetical protein SAMN02746095_02777 [Acidocella aminolytica 101 = DSM 11237]|uniref:Uncharacterized protein n=1 Tax=Acidocella aminolytica 101 = DSM 11237 TaxID=1120923 RepID=A0A0D6PEQ3_9PROT|nr:hypothetical protein Aam_040_058 [Acidocella aminolytica 101 = DSM 11237]GBQ37176.1 hypothetical protein AA11237_1451 [Acidocella aminolytica 101 = DSM 11237]SHF30218.1 hypothetical protein SAMN02746095_02777 [Acidocella aminolytica 101 = DSM 11237]
MLFFLVVLAFALVLLPLARAADIEGLNNTRAPRRAKMQQMPASELINGASPSGLY